MTKASEAAGDVVIFAGEQDADVAYVAQALVVSGARVLVFDQAATLASGAITAGMEAGRPSAWLDVNGEAVDLLAPGTRIWNRKNLFRLRDPGFETRVEFQEASTNAGNALACLKTALHADKAVNTWHAHERMSVKTEQLRVAHEAGLVTPRTLVSSNPQRVKDFCRNIGDVCVKPFVAANFNTDETSDTPKVFYTTRLKSPESVEDSMISASPLIYQELVTKHEDVRLVAFGDQQIALSIANKGGSENIDYKESLDYLARLKPRSIPESIRDGVARYMRAGSLGYAAFDFAVDHDGVWYFLEANTAGRFVWMEIYCEEVQVLAPFCRYLLGTDSSALPSDASSPFPSTAEIIDEAERRYAAFV